MIIKKLTVSVFIILSGIISCNNDKPIKELFYGKWNVKNISGGFAGIDDNYIDKVITWTFTDTLINIKNNNTVTVIYDGFQTGSYTYTILKKENLVYLLVEGKEFGRFTPTDTTLLIDQNFSSTANGADGFQLRLER